MEFEGACSKKMDANPVAVVEALIHINNQLHQHEVKLFSCSCVYIYIYTCVCVVSSSSVFISAEKWFLFSGCSGNTNVCPTKPRCST